jgi:hypothetical protein
MPERRCDMNQYIITEEQWLRVYHVLPEMAHDIYSHPYNPREGMVWMTSEEEETRIRQAEREKVLDELERRVEQELMDKRYTPDSKGVYIAVLAWIRGLRAGGKL